MKLVFTSIFILFFGFAQAQSFQATLFASGDTVQLEMWCFDAFRAGDSIHTFATLVKTKDIYSLKIDSIWKNSGGFLWSKEIIQAATFPVTVTSEYQLEIKDQKAIYSNLQAILLNDVVKRTGLTEDDERLKDPWTQILYYPGAMYEAYFQPYLEVLKYFFNGELENGNKRIWAEGFNEPMPSKLKTECSFSGKKVLSKHTIIQDSVEICDFLQMPSYEDGRSCPFLRTEYKFDVVSTKRRKICSPVSINYEAIQPVSKRIRITVL